MKNSICWFLVLFLIVFTSCKDPSGKRKRIRKDSSDQSSTDQNNQSDESVSRIRTDIGLASIIVPPGWLPNRSNGNTVAILSREGANRAAPQELISIDVGKAKTDQALDTANEMAKKFGGTVASQPFEMDGDVAYRVSIPPNYRQLMPRECIVVHHDGQACFLFGASKKNSTNIGDIVESIAKDWKWN